MHSKQWSEIVIMRSDPYIQRFDSGDSNTYVRTYPLLKSFWEVEVEQGIAAWRSIAKGPSLATLARSLRVQLEKKEVEDETKFYEGRERRGEG